MIQINKPLIYVHFKYIFEGKARELKTPGSIINPDDKKQTDGLLLWDTGATTSCINSKFVSVLGLKIKGVAPLYTANGVIKVHRYIAYMVLTNTQQNETMSLSSKLLITSADLSEDILGIIGMDIIGMGSFLLHYNKNVNKHILQFSFPGLKKLDKFSFKNERDQQNKKALKVLEKVIMKSKK